MVYYAVIDTNVLVSALLAKHEDASTLQIVRRMLRGDIIPLFDAEILREYAEVLRRPKFHFPEDSVRVLLEAISRYGEWVDRLFTGMEVPNPKDLVFYEVAMAKQDEAAHLVTGNKKHFPVVPFVVTPNEMLDIMNR